MPRHDGSPTRAERSAANKAAFRAQRSGGAAAPSRGRVPTATGSMKEADERLNGDHEYKSFADLKRDLDVVGRHYSVEDKPQPAGFWISYYNQVGPFGIEDVAEETGDTKAEALAAAKRSYEKELAAARRKF